MFPPMAIMPPHRGEVGNHTTPIIIPAMETKPFGSVGKVGGDFREDFQSPFAVVKLGGVLRRLTLVITSKINYFLYYLSQCN
jgi:hypothetical protein